LGLLFDIISLLVFHFWAGKHSEWTANSVTASARELEMSPSPILQPELEHIDNRSDDALVVDLNSDLSGVAAENINMLSALMHVGSDLLRSTTTLVEAFVIIYFPR
jgi:Co/Zn/Cd efflux system component